MQRQPLPNLSRVEWLAVAVALNDAANDYARKPESASMRGRLARLFRRATGKPCHGGDLTDPKLDAVRRFLRMTKRQSDRAAETELLLQKYGFTPAQTRALALLSK